MVTALLSGAADSSSVAAVSSRGNSRLAAVVVGFEGVGGVRVEDFAELEKVPAQLGHEGGLVATVLERRVLRDLLDHSPGVVAFVNGRHLPVQVCRGLGAGGLGRVSLFHVLLQHAMQPGEVD